MAWISMRRSVPCVLRHHGDPANDPDSTPSAGPSRRWLALLLLVGAVTAFSLARSGMSDRSIPQEFSWRSACLIAVLGEMHLRESPSRELCIP